MVAEREGVALKERKERTKEQKKMKKEKERKTEKKNLLPNDTILGCQWHTMVA